MSAGPAMRQAGARRVREHGSRLGTCGQARQERPLQLATGILHSAAVEGAKSSGRSCKRNIDSCGGWSIPPAPHRPRRRGQWMAPADAGREANWARGASRCRKRAVGARARACRRRCLRIVSTMGPGSRVEPSGGDRRSPRRASAGQSLRLPTCARRSGLYHTVAANRADAELGAVRRRAPGFRRGRDRLDRPRDLEGGPVHVEELLRRSGLRLPRVPASKTITPCLACRDRDGLAVGALGLLRVSPLLAGTDGAREESGRDRDRERAAAQEVRARIRRQCAADRDRQRVEGHQPLERAIVEAVLRHARQVGDAPLRHRPPRLRRRFLSLGRELRSRHRGPRKDRGL